MDVSVSRCGSNSALLTTPPMTYSAQIARATPGYVCFLIDQSGSMSNAVGGSGTAKSAFLADAVNRVLEELSLTSVKGEDVRHYFDISVIGYSTNNIGSAFVGQLAGRDTVSIVDVVNRPARLEKRKKKVPDGAGGVIEEEVAFPVWIDAANGGNTPMCDAFAKVKGIVEIWAQAHPNSFPPVVLHFTDGESTDGDPSQGATDVQSISTAHGNALLLNVHISQDKHEPIQFPASDAQLPNEFARMLFRMSSELPEPMRRRAASMGYKLDGGARGFIYNAKVEDIVAMLEVGTRSTGVEGR
jgi:hypothetical protein